MFRIVHLSDIHLNNNTKKDAEEFVYTALIKDIAEYNRKSPINMIAISGDLIDRGGESFSNDLEIGLMTFEEIFIDKVIKKISLSRSRVFFAPGNHDVIRNKDDKIVECGLSESLINTTTINDFISSEKHVGIDRIKDFKNYETAFYTKFDGESKLTKFQSVFKFQDNNLSIGVNCLNSSWRCYDSEQDKNRILLGERQLTDPRELINSCDLKIAIMHHPIEWLKEFDQKDIKNIITKDYDILLCGHVHQGESWSKTDIYGSIFISIAPSNWTYNLRQTDKNLSIGYSIIDFDIANHKIINHSRRYSKQKNKFDPNTDLGDDTGISKYSIPHSDKITKIEQEIEIAQYIKDNHFEEINEHLLTYNTDTKAPKNINELFVMPSVVDKIEYDSDEEEKSYGLSDLCATEENFIIFGTKESGKTILLDKILIELTSSIESFQKVPVQLNFEDVGNKKFETIISRFLKINIRDLSDYIDKHKIILLIDNLDFSSSNFINLYRLETFLNQNSSIQIIATSLQLYEGDIPLEISQFTLFSNFSSSIIKSFNVTEIKALIKNWFLYNDTFNTPTKIDTLLNVLIALNLPRSPLAISMFLWILEQQENYKPVNHATMLENFVERMFKKQSKKEIFSDVFDYKNKERLLTDIAYHMLNTDLENYKITNFELIKFVNDYLRAKRFEDFSTEDIIKHFFDKGIFIREYDGAETFIRFRFTCFFQYFLTKKMEFDVNFKQFVLDEKNFLRFNNEIEYYTGLKRDQSDILLLIIGRMKTAFKTYIDDINSLQHGFDQMFLTGKSFIEKIDASKFLKKITNEKPDEKQIDRMKDRAIESIKPENGIKKKSEKLSDFKKLERLWTLAAQVLKNTEETNKDGLKDSAYKDTIECSMAFASLYKYNIEEFFKNQTEKTNKNFVKQLELQRNILPLFHQMVIRYLMGTRKLSSVIRDKIEKDQKSDSVSDFERYLSVFLYADLKGKNYTTYINSFIKHIKQKYMFDMALYKLIFYYYFRSNSKESDLIFLNFIAELMTRSKKQSKRHKSKIIMEYKNKKVEKISSGRFKDTIIDA